MAYDAEDGYAVLFGGEGAYYGYATWIFRSGMWTQLTPPASPVGRFGAGMAYDAVDRYVVMFGGANTTYQGGTYFGDTWLFEGGSWTQINPPISPPARVDAAMAYDAADGYIVMFGGVGAGTNNILADTWTFRGGTWTQLAPPPAPSPSGRDASEMTFDAADGKIILFGGYDLSSGWLNDTWTFSAGSWTQLTPSVSPQPRASPTLAYDAIDGYVLLFGGNGNRGYLNDTWTFLGGSWTQLVPSVSPPSRDLPAIAYDGKGGYIVIFGGWNTRGGVLGDTWVYAAHLIAFVSINPESVEVGQMASFACHAADGVPPYSYIWNFGDGNTTLGQTAAHRYARVGLVTAKCTVSDGQGASAVSLATITVDPGPTVVISAIPSMILLGQPVRFITNAIGGSGGYNYSWSGLPPGCEAPSNSSAVSCVPTSEGTFEVSVNVTDSRGGSTTSTVKLTVGPGFLGLAVTQGYAALGLIVASVAGVGLIFVVRLRRRRRAPPPI